MEEAEEEREKRRERGKKERTKIGLEELWNDFEKNEPENQNDSKGEVGRGGFRVREKEEESRRLVHV